jgi:hypothetical protein
VLFKNDPADDKWLSWTMREAGGRMEIISKLSYLETVAAKPISDAAKSTLQKIGLCCEKLRTLPGYSAIMGGMMPEPLQAGG